MSALTNSALIIHKPWCVDSAKRTQLKNLTYRETKELLATVDLDYFRFALEDGSATEDTITFSEVAALSKVALDALFEAWTQLRNIVTQKETTLIKRWSGKSASQKKAVLLKAWPGMPLVHRPDFQVLRAQKKSGIATIHALQFPHINVEDLSKQKNLILMLSSRSRHFPSTFTNADQDSLQLGIEAKILVPKYMRGYAMYLNGQHTPDTYGRLVSWKQDRQALLACFAGVAPDPGMGLMILEVQRDVLQFLVRCSALIMHDTPLADLVKTPISTTSDPSEAQHALPQIRKTTSRAAHDCYAELTAQIVEAPYLAPDAFNFTRLESLVEAKFREAEDHFLLIREDPGYFTEVVREACEHSNEAAVLNLKYYPRFTRLSDDAWNAALFHILSTSYFEVFMWEAILHLLRQLIVTYNSQEAVIQLGQVLPNTYVEAASLLAALLDDTITGYLSPLPPYISAVPTFKRHIRNESYADGCYTQGIMVPPGTFCHSRLQQCLIITPFNKVQDYRMHFPKSLPSFNTVVSFAISSS